MNIDDQNMSEQEYDNIRKSLIQFLDLLALQPIEE